MDPLKMDSKSDVTKVLMHHINQHHQEATRIAAANATKPTVFYIGIEQAESKPDGTITSYGSGTFAGPLKSATKQDREKLITTFPAMAASLRERLVDKTAPIMLIASVSVNKITHLFVAGLSSKTPEGSAENGPTAGGSATGDTAHKAS